MWGVRASDNGRGIDVTESIAPWRGTGRAGWSIGNLTGYVTEGAG